MKKFYKLINSIGYVLSNEYNIVAHNLLGYGGVWVKDHRKAKRFKTQKEAQEEVNKMPYNRKFLLVSSNENWKKEFKKYFNKKDIEQ